MADDNYSPPLTPSERVDLFMKRWPAGPEPTVGIYLAIARSVEVLAHHERERTKLEGPTGIPVTRRDPNVAAMHAVLKALFLALDAGTPDAWALVRAMADALK
jgi:hypothetical protein